MTLPYMFTFYGTWIATSVARPVLALTAVALLSKPQAAIRKFELFYTTVQYLLLCKDKKFKAPPKDPASYFEEGTDNKIERKTIIFVRHGESTWNDTFNKGDRKTLAFIQGFIPGVVKAVCMEWYFWVAGQETESWFYDAPLSKKGLTQAESIHDYLSKAKIEFMPPKEKQIMKYLLGQQPAAGTTDGLTVDNNVTQQQAYVAPDSQLVSSNLRRAVATMAVGFQSRLDQTREAGKIEQDQIMILPELQEISFNPDALCITPAHKPPVTAFSDPKSIAKIYEQQINTKLHTGNKKLSENGLHRLQAFCKLVFDEKIIPSSKSAVIAAGHSLWFRSFFRTYLPYSVEHISKQKKLQNGGIVAFTLQRTKGEGGDYHYLIEPKSIVVMHRGF
eukprot:CAMPEP_0198155578 /NCGR_PEP_ID=MMETSP1443-20131203/69207_1 /TAXON_ID=186043 /ORGANISM="Entomoneis sp., Strain CCMP2396" /LENGTH=389 /DNA_ID=CAMNT_0043822333 /DNA_START=95 /DNA_END=1264 /DNA_ORIENTATION=-